MNLEHGRSNISRQMASAQQTVAGCGYTHSPLCKVAQMGVSEHVHRETIVYTQ